MNLTVLIPVPSIMWKEFNPLKGGRFSSLWVHVYDHTQKATCTCNMPSTLSSQIVQEIHLFGTEVLCWCLAINDQLLWGFFFWGGGGLLPSQFSKSTHISSKNQEISLLWRQKCQSWGEKLPFCCNDDTERIIFIHFSIEMALYNAFLCWKKMQFQRN